jgi:hypothetical protein
MGNRICPLDDVDGDKSPDFALDDGCGWIWLVSGRTGSLFARLDGDKQDSRFSEIAALFGDVDGDGAWDLADWHGNQQRQFRLLIRSGKELHALREFALPEESLSSYGLTPSARTGAWTGCTRVASASSRERPAGGSTRSGRATS